MSNDIKLDVLAIGAHPDDVELACGGTLIKLVSLGYEVGVMDMARGEMGTRGNAEIRAKEASNASRAMGLTVRDNLELPDGRIWLSEDSRVKMARKIRQYRPRVVFTHFWDDPHPDHVHTCQIVREGAHVSGLAKYDAESGLARWRPHAIAHFMFPRTVAPSFVVDISDWAVEKAKAISCYRSQLYDPQSKEPETNLSTEYFLRRVDARQRFYGSLIMVEHAEAFVVKEALNVLDPVELLTRKMNMYS
jgi:bacillithiol biosynthesis deacetylase BshB1